MSESEARITSMSAHESATNLTNMVERDVSNAWQYRNNIQDYIRQTSNAVAQHDQLDLACTEYQADLELISTAIRHWFADNGFIDEFNSLATEINLKTKRFNLDLHLQLYKAEFNGEISFYATDHDDAQNVIDNLQSDIENELRSVDNYEESDCNFHGPSTD